MSSYFAPGVLVFAAGDAAGEGLAAGLGVLVVALGERDVVAAGLAVGVVESLTGSLAQPAANPIGTMARSKSTVRVIRFILEVLITFCLVRARLKSEMMIARTLITSNGCSHRRFAGDLRFVCTESLVFERVLARLANALAGLCRLLSQQRIGVNVCTFPITFGIREDGDRKV